MNELLKACRRLRELEAAIAAQRRLVENSRPHEAEGARARERLSALLLQLDVLLGTASMDRAA
jgi:hypothetical protein